MYRTNPVFQPFLFVIDAIGYLLFFWLKFRTLKEPKRILLIRLEHAGDVLMTTPAFRALRKRFPSAKIDVLVRDFTAPLLKNNKNIDRVIVWNAPWLSKLGKKESWKSFPRMARALPTYDLAIDFHGDIWNILFALHVAKYRIGFGVRGLGFLLNKVVPYRGHTIDRNLALAKALGADTRDRTMELHMSQADKRFAKTKLKAGKWICIGPGSGRTEKNWYADRWATLADKLIEQHKVKIVFTGSNREKNLVMNITNQMRHKDKTLDLSGKTSLSQLAAVIQRCLLVICPDSGTMHIARAQNVPLVGLFTVENPREWGYDEPCYQNLRGKNIPVEAVLQKANKIYSKSSELHNF